MQPDQIFTRPVLDELFPAERTNEFFDALFGDADEGSYTIQLEYDSYDPATQTLRFLLDLHQRPGCCLVCNLTYGLPEVFKRHPIINIAGLVKDVEQRLGNGWTCGDWSLGSTLQHNQERHSIPLTIHLNEP
ncbi:MAG: pancreas/duodenum homeobox protein 1 [Desulfobulbus sp.]